MPKILAPLVVADIDLGWRVERIHAYLSVSAQDNRPHVARSYLVRAHEVDRALAKLVERVVNLDAIDFAGIEQPPHVIIQAEDRWALLCEIAADTFKDGGAI